MAPSEHEVDAQTAYSKIQSLLAIAGDDTSPFHEAAFPDENQTLGGFDFSRGRDSIASFKTFTQSRAAPQTEPESLHHAATPFGSASTTPAAERKEQYSPSPQQETSYFNQERPLEFSYNASMISAGSSSLMHIGEFDVSRSALAEAQKQRLKSADQAFHDLLQLSMQMRGDAVVAAPAADFVGLAERAGRLAYAMHNCSVEMQEKVHRQAAQSISGSAAAASFGNYLMDRDRNGALLTGRAAVTHQELQACRAERDLWALLEVLTLADLLDDVDESASEAALNDALESLPLIASIPEYIGAAYSCDTRLKKGAILKEWVEKAAVDRVTDAPAPFSDPWGDTCSRLLDQKMRSNGASATVRQSKSTAARAVNSMHPDAQVTAQGLLLPLDGVDQSDQENLLKAIWQLVRSGQIADAQALAARHRIFWLAAALQGAAAHYYKQNQQDENDMATEIGQPELIISTTTRLGNQRQPVWMLTSWAYASRLGGQSDAIAVSGTGAKTANSVAGLLEMSIFAALSNNTGVLMTSPLLATWHDRLWCFLKAVHERDLCAIIHRYRCSKLQSSILYPGCEPSIIAAERRLLDQLNRDIGHMTSSNCVQILNKVAPPPVTSGSTAAGAIVYSAVQKLAQYNSEGLLLSFQAAVMEGMSGLVHFIESTLTRYLLLVAKARTEFQHSAGKNSNSQLVLNRQAQVLRVLSHFVIWLKQSPSNSKQELAEVVGEDLRFAAIECYIDYLLDSAQFTLVAAYAAHLNRPRRIIKYAELLHAVQRSPTGAFITSEATTSASSSSSLQAGGADPRLSEEAVEVMQLANTFFPQDVLEISRCVMDRAHRNTLLKLSTSTADGASTGLYGQPTRTQQQQNQEKRSVRFQNQLKASSSSSMNVGYAIGLATPLQSANELLSLSTAGRLHPSTTAGVGHDAGSVHTNRSSPSVASSTLRRGVRTSTPRRRIAGFSLNTNTDGGVSASQSAAKPVGSVAMWSSAPAAIVTAFINGYDESQLQQDMLDLDSELGTNSDLSKMEALRWLYYDTNYRIEAITQTNRCIVHFLLESGGAKLPLVKQMLANYLPADSVAVGESFLRQKYLELEDQISSIAAARQQQQDHGMFAGSYQSMNPQQQRRNAAATAAENNALAEEMEIIESERRKVSLESDLWSANVCKLELWHSVVESMQSVAVFYHSLQELQAEARNSTGIMHLLQSSSAVYRLRIARSANCAVDSIVSAIRCSNVVYPVQYDEYAASTATATADVELDIPCFTKRAQGFRDVVVFGEEAGANYVLHIVSELDKWIDQFPSSIDQQNSTKARLRSMRDIVDAATELRSVVMAVYEADSTHLVPSNVNETCNSIISSMEDHMRDLDPTMDWDSSACSSAAAAATTVAAAVDGSTSSGKLGDSDDLLSVITSLQQCTQHLRDMQHDAEVLCILLFQLLLTYLQVCLDAAAAVGALGFAREAHQWHTRAMQLADLLASDEDSLQLHRILQRDELELLLQGINSAALAALALGSDAAIH